HLRNINHYLMDIVLNDENVNEENIENVISTLKKQEKLLENSNENFEYNENFESNNENMIKINTAINSIVKNTKEVTCGSDIKNEN
ncbi:hypothetical protein QUF55_05000, partial [Clostridiaceae bacterium HSG29]|nr:hypothetical protein [Clostridiaceae bacterium HSG29]